MYQSFIAALYSPQGKLLFFFKGSIVKLIYFLVKSKYLLEIDDNFEYLHTEVPTQNLLQILRSPMLKSIKICASRNLTSECMENVLAFNELEYLELLELNKCHEISFDSLEILLEAENKLNHVRVLRCDQITKRDVQFYQMKCKKWKCFHWRKREV